MTESLHIDTLAAGRRPLKDTDSADTSTTRDPNLRHIMVDDPATGRRPAAVPADLWNHGGAHQKWSVDDFTLGRHPMGSDPLSALLATAGFYAPLKSTLVLTRGTGNPTFTRATTAWEFDNEGKLIAVPSGAARFGGGRAVVNLCPTPSNTLTVGANKTVTFASAATVTFSMGAGAGTATFSGTGGATGTLSAGASRVQVTKTITAGTFVVTASVADLVDLQIENVSGQADQTASDYISVGVLSAPYHGAGTGGVKWFSTNKNGSAISESSLLGYHAEGARTNSLLYSRDLTNAAWTATNIAVAKTATGIDNVANSASTLTAGAANAIILQTLTLASAARSSSSYVKRRTGSGNIYFTRDGGSTWTDITSSVGTSWTRVKIENTSVTNPSIGFKIDTSGDEIDVDCVQDEADNFISSPIITTTAAVTRNADALNYPKASNMIDSAGSAFCSWSVPYSEANISSIINSILTLSVDANGRMIYRFATDPSTIGNAYDGTSGHIAVSTGLSRADSVHRKQATTWNNSTTELKTITEGGSIGTVLYDGTMGAGSTIQIATDNIFSYTKNVYIWQSALTTAQLQQVTA